MLSKIFRLQPGEAGPFLALGLLLLANSFTQQVNEIVALSNFINEGGVNPILLVWLVDSLVILGITALQSLVIDRFKRAAITRVTLLVLAAIFILLRVLFLLEAPGWLNYGLMYVVSEQQWLFVPLVFWVLAGDIFDVSQAKRLYAPIASIGVFGRLLGIFLSAALPSLMTILPAFQTVDMLLVNAAIYMLALFIFNQGMKTVKVRQTVQVKQDVKETLLEGWGFVKEVLSFRYLMISMLAAGVVICILDFHFLSVSGAAIPDPNQFQIFYSFYRLGLTLLVFFVQSVVTSRLIENLGLKKAFFVFPVTLLVGSLLLLASPGLLIATAAIGLGRMMQATVDESTLKSFQVLVPEERRGRVSIFMDSYLFAGGTILGCLLTLAVVYIGQWLHSDLYSYAYLALALLASASSVWAIVKMYNVYDSSMLNWRLKRRQRRTSVLDKLDF